MITRYQGVDTESNAKTVAEFLAAKSIDAAKAIVEYAGDIYAPGSDLATIELKPGAPLDVFKMMAGG